MKLIERKFYLQQLIDVMNTPDIKVITGIRRSGKSKLMDAFISYVQNNVENGNIIRIKLNLKEFEALKTGDALYEYVSERYESEKENFLFIDEVQLCNGFEDVINSLYEEERFNVFLTGSNAFLLSSDLATLFGGRVFEISLFPFSFSEYLLYYPDNDIDAAFDKYVTVGGMAGSYLYNKPADAKKYLASIVRTTIIKDVVTKFKIENEDLLSMIVDFLMDNIGSKTSVRNVANKLTSNTYRTNDKTCGAYIDYLCRSFLFYPFKRYDVKGKRYLESDKKYYLADLALRYAIIGTKNADYGHLYENLVAIELLRRGFEVYVGQLGEKEVDFVAIKDGMKTYIQVSDDISREETLKREVSPLLSIRDAYPKMIIARTKHPESQIEGVRIVDIARWLVSQN
ncbi:MAG: ATP-binding protein [Ruminococcaceae bacterium]|nr:ATP-binding protein [Oscillospiraceae bacterium]